MNTPSIKITITGYEDLSITAEIPYKESQEYSEYQYFLESVKLLLNAADFFEDEEIEA